MRDKRILIVEDDEALAKWLAWLLQKEGYEPLVVKDAVYGLQEAEHFKPDLILLDLILPGGGGVALLEKIRHLSGAKKVPVIVLTGLADDQVRQEVMRLGARDYLRKPFQQELLIEKITQLLGDA